MLIFVTHLVILVVFNCHALARISTYDIHIVCSYFLVWYLYFYCAYVFLFFNLSFNISRNWISGCCYSISGIVLFLLLLLMFSVGTSFCVARLYQVILLNSRHSQVSRSVLSQVLLLNHICLLLTCMFRIQFILPIHRIFYAC